MKLLAKQVGVVAAGFWLTGAGPTMMNAFDGRVTAPDGKAPWAAVAAIGTAAADGPISLIADQTLTDRSYEMVRADDSLVAGTARVAPVQLWTWGTSSEI